VKARPRLPTVAAVLAACAIGLTVVLLTAPRPRSTTAPIPFQISAEVPVPRTHPSTSQPSPPRTLPGEAILAGFGSPSQPPREDLRRLRHLFDNALLLAKSARDRPLATPEDWGALLLGRWPGTEALLPTHHAALDSQARVIDRWGTPLHIHALGSGRFELRSAGPDRKLWTQDDVTP